MTLYYDEELDALVENHPDEWVEYDDDGHLLFDLSSRQKRGSLQHVAESAIEAHLPPVDEGDTVTYVDADGVEHEAIVETVWNENTINVAYADEGSLVVDTSVTQRDEVTEVYCWYE